MDILVPLVLLIGVGGLAYVLFRQDEKSNTDTAPERAPAPQPEPAPVPVPETPKLISDAKLKAMTKPKLAEYAKEAHGVTLSTSKTKLNMIADLKEAIKNNNTDLA